jgi:hypothetical protein
MSIDNPPTYTVRQLEEMARVYLADAYGGDPPVPPVDIDWLAEAVEGIDITDYPRLRTGYGIEGGVWRNADTGELVIVIAEEVMDDESPTGYARYRMTVAEELAHIRLHRTVIDQIDCPARFQELHRHPRWWEIERNAKRFAAALLMPPERILERAREVYPELVRVAGTGNAAAINHWLCERLAREFEVSRQSMGIRLREWPVRVTDQVNRAVQDGLTYLP